MNVRLILKHRFNPLGQEDPLKKEMMPTPVFFPGKCHAQRSLVGYSASGHKDPNTLSN